MTDAVGPGSSPQRVVSLVPWRTGSMIALGLSRHLVGITDLCPPPPSLPEPVKLGMPSHVKIAEVLSLHPDLVLADAEENPQRLIDEICASNVPIWSACPRTVRQALTDLRDIALLYASESILQSIVWLDRSVDWLEGSQPESRTRVFCPRKRNGPAEHPRSWETVGGDTYAGDLLSLCGAENIFAGNSSVRFPVVTPEDVAAADPEIILLPGDPFPFSEADCEAIKVLLPGLAAVKEARILTVDGRLLFWPAAMLGEAVQQLPHMFRIPE